MLFSHASSTTLRNDGVYSQLLCVMTFCDQELGPGVCLGRNNCPPYFESRCSFHAKLLEIIFFWDEKDNSWAK